MVASSLPKSGPICSSSALVMTHHLFPECWHTPYHPAGWPDHTGGGPDASAMLSAVLGRPVVLERAQSEQPSHAEIDPATVFGDLPVEQVLPERTAATMPDSFALPEGTFFDSGSIHVLASGTLAHLRTLIGADAQLDPRRFRPNILVETAPGVEGFLEDDWLEGTLEVGESVKIVQMRPTLRCVMTTHQQADLVRDLRILRTAAQHHHDHVGVGGHWHCGHGTGWRSCHAREVSVAPPWHRGGIYCTSPAAS